MEEGIWLEVTFGRRLPSALWLQGHRAEGNLGCCITSANKLSLTQQIIFLYHKITIQPNITLSYPFFPYLNNIDNALSISFYSHAPTILASSSRKCLGSPSTIIGVSSA